MNEYIRKQDMLDAVEKLDIIPSTYGTGKPTPTEDFRVQFLGTVLKVPAADVVPVVRCGQCIYCKTNVLGRLSCRSNYGCIVPRLDAFCSYGERKE